ncbi:MAG: cytochrome c oxidase subunit II [Planctomycetota bacterium]
MRERRCGGGEKGAVEGLFLAFIGWGLVFLSVFVLGKKWLFPPLSSDRLAIDNLYFLILVITGTVFFIVKFLWGFFIWRFSSSKNLKASYWHHNSSLEIFWTLITAIILSTISLKGLSLWGAIYTRPPADAIIIEVVAQQFVWNVRYPGKDGKFGKTSAGLIDDREQNNIGIDYTDPASKDDIVFQASDEYPIYLPVDVPVVFRLTSRDVIHSFFIPHFRVKQDTVPGMVNEVWFRPKKIGEYELACAELCGLGHYKMRGKVRVVTKEEYEGWLSRQK